MILWISHLWYLVIKYWAQYLDQVGIRGQGFTWFGYNWYTRTSFGLVVGLKKKREKVKELA